MKKKVILTTVVSFVLLLLVVLAGLHAVYTVTSVRANFCTFSEEGESEARELREELDSFVNKSSVFLDMDDVRAAVEKYPYFRVEEAHKRYPDKLELKITERKEAFAYLREEDGKYVILDEQGEFLRVEDSNINRTGGKNILLEGFRFETEGEVKYFRELLQIFAVFQGSLSQVRANVTSVKCVPDVISSTPAFDYIKIQMREGVSITIRDPYAKTEEKARKAIERYTGTGEYEGNGLSDIQRIEQEITVYEQDGELKISPQP